MKKNSSNSSLSVWLAAAVAVVGLTGCSETKRVQLPSDQEIIRKKAEAPVHPTQNYYLYQAQVKVDASENLSGVLENLRVKNKIDASVLDEIHGQNVYLLEVKSSTPVADVVKALKADPHVLMAARNRRITLNNVEVSAENKTERPLFQSNDPQLESQWALSNTGQDAPGSLSGLPNADIGMGGANTEGSYDVVVGVIDTGVDYTHEDLAVTETVDGSVRVLEGSNIWQNPGEIPGNGVNDDNNGGNGVGYVDDVYGYNFVGRNGDPRDDQGHGTHVSGVIGALRNNFKGISGMNQKVSIMALKFLDHEGSGSDFDAQQAIGYAIEMKKKFPNKKFILSNSWGSTSRESQNGDEDDFLLEAFAAASRADILSIVAAGNDGTSNRFEPHFPANYSTKVTHMITVAATNNMDQLASFSSYGYTNVQVAAPGSMIQSTVPKYLYPVAYAAWSGTSMATPHVSGLAALVWAANPQMTGMDVKERILNTVDVLPQLQGSVSTSGRINVKRALDNNGNVSIMPIADRISYVTESPQGTHSGKHDMLTPVSVQGAKSIAVCFSSIDLNGNLMEIMGKDFRVRDTMTGNYRDHNWQGEERELCSAPVLGDTLYLRLHREGASSGRNGYQTKYLKVMR